MQVPHDSFVLVADGRKMLFFRNEGDAEFPNLIVERKDVHANPARSRAEERSRRAAPARAIGGRGSAMEEVDFHQLEEDRFAADTAEMLKARALATISSRWSWWRRRKTLGELRKHYHKEVEKRLVAEVPKDLVNLPVAEIEQILQAQ